MKKLIGIMVPLFVLACAEGRDDQHDFNIDPGTGDIGDGWDTVQDGMEVDAAFDAPAEGDAASDPGGDPAVDVMPDYLDVPPDTADVPIDVPVDAPVDSPPDVPVDLPEDDPAVEDIVEDDGGTVLCGGSPCPEGQSCCFDMYCADLSSDDTNCGSCGNSCWFNEADICSSGECICSGSGRRCSGFTSDYCCDSDGCRDLDNDEDHCGMCGWWCSGFEECIDGWCEDWGGP